MRTDQENPWFGDLVRRMIWARSLLYAHCLTAFACVGLVTYGMAQYDMAWQFRLQVERVLSYPGGWPAYHLLRASCLAFPVAVTEVASRRLPAWRWGLMSAADFVLAFVQYFALELAYPIRE